MKMPLALMGLIALAAALSSTACSSRSANTNSSIATAQDKRPSTSTAKAGESLRDDPKGDVVDEDGRKPSENLPGIDLTMVSVKSDGAVMSITFTASGEFPSTVGPGKASIWSLTACTKDGAQCCIFGAKIEDSNWFAYKFEPSPARNTYFRSPRVVGNELVITLMTDELPLWMAEPFTWRAASESDGLWSDRVPDDTGDLSNPATVSFPKN